MTAVSALPRPHVPASTIRLARALVEDARGVWVHQVPCRASFSDI